MLRYSSPFLIILLGLAGSASAGEYIEDFTTTAFKDHANTTAWWDTTAGELKLFPFEITLAGSVDTPGSAGGVFVDGDHAYVADLLPGLQVIDISDPTSPTIVGSYNTLGDARDVFVAGDHAYVADSGAGLQVIDISDPTNPTLAGGVDTPGSARDVFVDGDHAYVADTASGLQVIDISDPTTPVLAGSFDTPGSASGVFVAGDHAYVSDEGSGLQVIDISDPTNPTLAGSYDTPNIAWGVFVDGNHAFVADGGTGLQVIDISDPTSPALAGSYDTPGSARAVFVSGDRAYVGDGSSGLQIIDITDPTNPILADNYDTPGSATGVFVSGEHAFVGDGSSGLLVIDTCDPAKLSQAGHYFASAGDVAVSGDHAYVAGFLFGLRVFDIRDPNNPIQISSYDTPGSAIDVVVSGDHAYVADSDAGLQVIDISDPANPTLDGSYDTPNSAFDVAVSGDHAYVGDFSDWLVIDVRDPTNPTQVGSYSAPALGATVSGDHAYVAAQTLGLLVIDISNPANPVMVGRYDTSSATEVTVSGDHAYVCDQHQGLLVIDISDPTNPVLAGSYDTEGVPRTVAVSGDDAYVTDYPGSLLAIDISDPTLPTLKDSYETPGSASGVAVSGHHAYLGDGQDLRVIQIHQADFDAVNRQGQSVRVNPVSEIIPRVRVNTIQQGLLNWELRSGSAWTAVPATGTWTGLDLPGSDLRWRSTHWPSALGVNPVVSQLQIEWLLEPAVIDSIADVPGDQGGWVRLRFDRSAYDFADETNYPVTGYGVHRRVDDAELKAQVLAEAPPVAPAPDPGLSSFAGSALRLLDGRLYLDSNLLPLENEFPPGIWELVSWVPALQQDEYLALVPTVGDSTVAGITWSVYVTTTHTTTPSVWFVSPPDSGYSIDNIAPSAPTGLTYNAGVLTWDECPDEDFHYFTVYGGDTENFALAELIGYTIETTYDVSGSPFAWYFVTATDFAGGESEPASVESGTTGVEPEAGVLPIVYALHPASPNPFSRQTLLTFDLPERGFTRLEVYDVMGRLVETLVTDELPAGRHRLRWTGSDARGEALTPGLYFLRLESGRYSATGKLLRVK